MRTDPGSDDGADRGTTTISPIGRSITRYDLILAVIPLAFVLALTLGQTLSVPARTTVVAASIVGLVVLADALFLNPPRST